MKHTIQLKDGILELKELDGGIVVIGELLKGVATKDEIRSSLTECGYSHGILNKNLDAFTNGNQRQILLASGRKQQHEAGMKLHNGISTKEDMIIRGLQTGKFPDSDFSLFVQPDDRLVSITSLPKTVFLYPNGSESVLKTFDMNNIDRLCGKNTKLDESSKSIKSAIEGSVHCSVYGVVSVYPIRTFKNINQVHGKVTFKKSVKVEQDIRENSYVDIPSNIIVKGSIKSAFIKAEGNIICDNGIVDDQYSDKIFLHAGQAVYTTILKGYAVWAGWYVAATKTIENCNIQCLNTIITPAIIASDIHVGNRLYVNEILSDSKIFLGHAFVEKKGLEWRKNFQKQHAKKLEELETELNYEKTEMEKDKKKIITQLKNLKKSLPDKLKNNFALNLLCSQLSGKLENYRIKVEFYSHALDSFEKKRQELAFYDQHLNVDFSPVITVYGRIEPGTKIIAANQTMNVNQPIKNSYIKLDSQTGTLQVKPLETF